MSEKSSTNGVMVKVSMYIVQYTYEEICGHLLLLMYMAKIAAGTTMSTYLPLIGLHKL